MPKVSIVVVMKLILATGSRSMHASITKYQSEMSSKPRPTTTSPMTDPLRKATRNPLLSERRAALAVRAEA